MAAPQLQTKTPLAPQTARAEAPQQATQQTPPEMRVFHASPSRLEAALPLEHGGQVQVEAVRREGQTTATVSANTSALHAAVEQALPQLREQMSALGVSVEARAQSGSRNAEHSAERQSPPQPATQPTSVTRAAADSRPLQQTRPRGSRISVHV